MKNAGSGLIKKARVLLVSQAVLGLVVAAGFYLAGGAWDAVSALYGALVSLLNSFMLALSAAWAERVMLRQPGQGQAILYVGAVMRFVMVLLLFLLGFAVLTMAPLPTVVGFGAALLGYLLTLRRTG